MTSVAFLVVVGLVGTGVVWAGSSALERASGGSHATTVFRG